MSQHLPMVLALLCVMPSKVIITITALNTNCFIVSHFTFISPHKLWMTRAPQWPGGSDGVWCVHRCPLVSACHRGGMMAAKPDDHTHSTLPIIRDAGPHYWHCLVASCLQKRLLEQTVVLKNTLSWDFRVQIIGHWKIVFDMKIRMHVTFYNIIPTHFITLRKVYWQATKILTTCHSPSIFYLHCIF